MFVAAVSLVPVTHELYSDPDPNNIVHSNDFVCSRSSAVTHCMSVSVCMYVEIYM
jgi:hypothetical protein